MKSFWLGLSCAVGLLVGGCDAKKAGASSASAEATETGSAAAKKAKAPTKKPPADLTKVNDDELKAAVEAVGFKDPPLMRKADDDYELLSAFVKEPKMELRIYDFAKVSYRKTDFKPLISMNDKRVLRVSAMQGVGFEKLMADTMTMLKDGCVDLASCEGLLGKNSYGDINHLGGRAQLGPLGYSMINAKRGSEYVRTQVYDYKPEKADTVHFIKDLVFVAAMSDGDKAAPKEDIEKLLDCVR